MRIFLDYFMKIYKRSYRGFNFFSDDDQKLFEIIFRGEFNVSGFQDKNIRQYLTDKNSGQVSRILKRLHIHGLIKKMVIPTNITFPSLDSRSS